MSETHIDRKNTLLLVFLIVAILSAFVFAYTKYMVSSDYVVYAHVDCDKETENCYVRDCTDVIDDVLCERSLDENNQYYYKIIEANINYYSNFTPGSFFCGIGGASCVTVYCGEDSLLATDDACVQG